MARQMIIDDQTREDYVSDTEYHVAFFSDGQPNPSKTREEIRNLITGCGDTSGDRSLSEMVESLDTYYLHHPAHGVDFVAQNLLRDMAEGDSFDPSEDFDANFYFKRDSLTEPEFW